MIHFIRKFINILSAIISVFVYIILVFEVIFLLSTSGNNVFFNIHYFVFVLLFLDVLVRLIIRPLRSFGYIRVFIGLLSLLPILSYHGLINQLDINFGIQQVILLLIAVTRVQHLSFLFSPLRLSPAKSFIGGFILIILIGSFFLNLPSAGHHSMSYIDSLYMAVSAMCVTGLSVVDVGHDLTLFGQIVKS